MFNNYILSFENGLKNIFNGCCLDFKQTKKCYVKNFLHRITNLGPINVITLLYQIDKMISLI